MFIVKKPVTFRTSEGIQELNPWDMFQSRDLEALRPLLQKGIISHYCYWLDNVVDSCSVVCIDRTSICPYWEEWLEIRFSSNSTSHNKGK